MVKKIVILLIASIIHLVMLCVALIILAYIILAIEFSSPMAYVIQHDMKFRNNNIYEFEKNRYSKSDSLLIDSLLMSILKSHDNFKFVDIDTSMVAKDSDTEEDIERKIKLQVKKDFEQMKNLVKTYDVYISKKSDFLFYEKFVHGMRRHHLDAYQNSCYFLNFHFFIVPFCMRDFAA